MQFDRHTLVLLVRRPDAPELTDEEADELQDRHLAFRADLRDRGYLIGGGPLVDQDDERLRGISIMACDPETARRLSNEDPAVQAGRLAVEVMTWMVPAGNVRFERRARAAVDGRGGGGLTRLGLTRQQILAFRRRVGGLEERMPKSAKSLRQAAWAGLQDSMPRAALLSLHARVDGVEPSTWEHPSLAQLWGPRYSTYVVPKRDFALFSLGRLPDSRQGPPAGRAHGRAGPRPSQRHARDGPRGCGRTGSARERDQVRRDDRHGRDPLGRRAGADRLDSPCRRDRPGRRMPRARSALPPRLRADHG